MLGTRLVIPLNQRASILEDIHRGHLGITRSQTRARLSVWWPSMSLAIKEFVKCCRTCNEESRKPVEPLRPTATPERPWQMLGSDLFHFGGQTYLLLVDYYSRYPEIALLGRDTSSANVINHMKSIFSRHGIPDCLLSDNGPQYASNEFRSFATEYGFTHVTSSPRYPRGNGTAERAVQTVKLLLKKEQDPYLALLSYRVTPQDGSYSPAQLLMGRNLRSTLTTHPDTLAPKLPDHAEFRQLNDTYKDNMKHNHDNRYVRDLRPIDSGERVVVRDNKQHGTVVGESQDCTRSVIVSCDSGQPLRRNRAAIIATPVNNDIRPYTTTRSGRHVVPPKRLDDYVCQ